ncbi:hypothetical protein Fcan01_02025 [Folsomia candida]|uniref:Uncharacterized protein n=1 Tax=Folsomia candida TaxID=158441 RepID=A0A226EW71_FOLCA|nr:hypothetical protein Fcan01_02025 [Folsomia candida]
MIRNAWDFDYMHPLKALASPGFQQPIAKICTPYPPTNPLRVMTVYSQSNTNKRRASLQGKQWFNMTSAPASNKLTQQLAQQYGEYIISQVIQYSARSTLCLWLAILHRWSHFISIRADNVTCDIAMFPITDHISLVQEDEGHENCRRWAVSEGCEQVL